MKALEREYRRLKRLFKRVETAALFVSLADKKLYLLKWYQDLIDKGLEPTRDRGKVVV